MSQNLSGSRNIISFLLISAILILFVYLSSNPYERKKDTIHIGVTQWPGFEYLFIAKKQGFFKKAGLDVELVELSSLSEVRRAFERDKIDGMAATLVEVLEAYKYSSQIAQPILVIDYSEGADEILAVGNINSISELKGKKIGVEAGSMSAYLVSTALEIHNVKYSDVVIIPMKLHALPKALKSGMVDAITSYAPVSVAIKKQLNVNVIFDSSEVPQKLLDIIAINSKFLANNSELQNKLIHAWELTLNFVDEYPDESYSILTERMHISTDDFKNSMKLIHLVSAEEQNIYFNKNGIINNNLLKTGEIVFMNLDNHELDYSKFLLNETIN